VNVQHAVIPTAPDTAQCLGCRYSLAGLSAGVCPECGRAFDPEERGSFGPVVRRDWEREIVAWRPSWWLLGSYAAINALIVLVFAGPDGEGSETIKPGVFFWYVANIVLVVTVSCILLSSLSDVRARDASARLSRRWFALPATLTLCIPAWWTGAVFDARWAASSGSFASLARTPAAAWKPGVYGAFIVTRVTVHPDGSAELRLGFPDWYGDSPSSLIWAPMPNPQVRMWGAIEDLGNGWKLRWDPT
jgi:hypothetical protein